ncbi:MAG: MATE family efflux transporter [Christensenellales bacterium]
MSEDINYKRFLSTMLRLAFPIAMQNLLIASMHIIDTAMVVGLGNVNTAAIGVASRWVFLINLFFFGFCSGGSAFISQYWGVRDLAGIRRTYGLAVANTLVLGLIYTLAAMLAPGAMIRLYTGEAAVVEAGVRYLRTAAPGALATAYVTVTAATLRATERVWLPFATSAFAVLLNTLLNWCLIYGHMGFPALGVTGAALATVIAMYVHAALLMALSRRGRDIVVAPFSALIDWSRAFVARFYRIALPVVFNEALWAVGTNIYSMVLARQGSENYAAYTVYSSIEQLAFVLFIGLCSACAIMVGKAIGAGQIELGWRWSKRFLMIIPAVAVVIGSLLILLRWPVVRLLNIETAYTEAMTARLLLIYGLWMTVRMIPYITIVGIFRAGGDTWTGFLIDSVNVFALGVPVTCVLGLVLSVPFHYLVLAMYVTEDSLKCVMCLKHFMSRKWIRRLTAGAEPECEPQVCVREE